MLKLRGKGGREQVLHRAVDDKCHEQHVGSAGGATSPDAEAGPSKRRPRFRLALTVYRAMHVIPDNLCIQKNQL